MFESLNNKLVSWAWSLKPTKHTFTVDRKRWLRGEDLSLSKLKRAKDGKLDALGFYLTSIGLTEEEISDVGNPGYLPKDLLIKHNLLRSWLFLKPEEMLGSLIPSDECMDIIRFNDKKEMLQDNQTISIKDSYREQKLKSAFRKQGIKIRFVG